MAELFRINAVNANEIAALFEQAPEITAEEMRAGIWEASLLLERELKDAAPTGATHNLRQGISAKEPKVLANNVIGEVGTSSIHALPVELGTKPHFPPVAPIKDWVKSKLNVEASRVDSVAFLIARKISRVGTKAQPFFKATFEANKKQVETIFIASANRVLERLAHG